MYSTILFLHSIFRWLLLASLCNAIFRSYKGLSFQSNFVDQDHKVFHSVATIAHIQLSLGMILYIKSPMIQYYFSNFKDLDCNSDLTFFSLIHFILMITAVVFITMGSAKVKHKKNDKERFMTILKYFSLALIIIFIAIPWPFSPLASRPFIRTF